MDDRHDVKTCSCGNCCGCKGVHGDGLCPHPRCAEPRHKENILHLMAEAEAVGDGDKSDLNSRVENRERQIVESPGKSMIQPLDRFEAIAAEQAEARAIQEDAAMRGIRPSELRVGEHGSVVGSKLTGGNMAAPRVNDFLLIDTPMSPEKFLDLVNAEVLGNYDRLKSPAYAEFGLIVMQHVSGLPDLSKLLPVDASGFGKSPLANARPMIIAKLDTGPWEWYDRASMAIMAGIVKSTGRRAWRCGWSIDKEWSWVEHWRADKNTGAGKMTETIDGPANATVTAKAKERWGIDVRAAFDALHRAAQWEALRQYLLCGKDGDPASLPSSFVARVSFLAGNLQCSDKDREWVPQEWKKLFGDRKPFDGPLHLQAYYEANADLKKLAPSSEGAPSSRTEPPSLGLESGERF